MRLNKYLKGRRGMTLIELTIVIAISGILIIGILKLFQTSSDIWTSSLHSIDIQQKGRAAVEEITRFVRQSTSPATGISPAIGGTSSSLKFTFLKDTSTFTNMEYFKSGSALYRVSGNSTSTLIENYVDSIYFKHVSSYVVTIETFTLTKGTGKNQKTLTFERTINLRNR
ncbi:MAG: hypothetical protein CVU78_04805 [Elusimicrobia bacterium HGW-Elusimicrobia-2]|nr:MAG: hypothetical protein CVU78_04805 [Elusimicrobia bacterium HGW-Elusimicrobia-2]